MPILDLQRRMAETGRIRMGEKKPNERFPRKLETFRFTSANQALIEACAAEWGGTVEPWESPNGAQHQVVTEAKSIDVILLPANMAFSQWRELWSGGGCQRRCDSVTETISDQPCVCDPDPAKRECKDTTRLSVMLPDIPGAGLWRLESHGYYAATELAGTLEVVSNLAPGMLARGTLTAEPRSAKRFKADGSPVTNRYIVPVLDLPELRLKDRMLDTGDGVSVEIETRTPGLTAVPELPEGPRMSVADQLAAPPPEQKRRSNAAAELPATGLRPKGAPPLVEDDEPEEEQAAAPEPTIPASWTQRNKKLQAEVHDLWKGDSDNSIDERRKVLVSMASDDRTRSSKDLSDEEWDVVFATTESLRRGDVELVAVDGGWDLRAGEGSGAPTSAPTPTGIELPADADAWRALLAEQKLTQRDLMEEAWSRTGRKGLPGNLAGLVQMPEVAAELLVWLHQRAAA